LCHLGNMGVYQKYLENKDRCRKSEVRIFEETEVAGDLKEPVDPAESWGKRCIKHNPIYELIV
jgi:hypothetical protein